MTHRSPPLLVVLTLVSGCADTTWIDPMERQKRFEPYQESEFFEDGRAMRPLVEGAIAREHVIGPPALISGLDGGKYVSAIPIAITSTLMSRGRQRFNITCAACHGHAGNGHSVVASKMSLRPPPSLVDAPIADYPVGRVFQVISLGFGLMAPYSAELSIEERWAVVAYWEALKLSKDAPLSAAAPVARQRLEQERRNPPKQNPTGSEPETR